MSDELRDLLKQRAGDVAVPSDDLGGVVRGGRALKWRKRMYSAGAVVLVGLVAWTTAPDLLSTTRDEKRPPVGGTPTPSPDETPAPGRCGGVPFRPTYLPAEWSYILQRNNNQPPRINGSWTS